MLTVDTRFQQIATQFLEERIDEVTKEIAAGQLPDFPAYARRAGCLQGLREALALLSEAQSQLSKER